MCNLQNPTKRGGGILYKMPIKISDKTQRILQIAWISFKIKLDRLKKKSKLPLSFFIMLLVFDNLFQFYDLAPTWARVLFTLYIWRSMGKVVSEWN